MKQIRICNHCGWDILLQPQKETGCNHVYYPEMCPVCRPKAVSYVMTPTYNLDAVSKIIDVITTE